MTHPRNDEGVIRNEFRSRPSLRADCTRVRALFNPGERARGRLQVICLLYLIWLRAPLRIAG
jgi:hypothetical protein